MSVYQKTPVTAKIFMSKLCKELLQINKKNWHLNRHFTEEDAEMANKYMKKCTNPLLTWKTPVKTTRARMKNNWKSQNKAHGNANKYNHFGMVSTQEFSIY